MIEALSEVTYMVRHNPNCPKRFEVRICGDAPIVEAPPGRFADRNVVGYGNTVDEAVDQITAQIEERAAVLLAKIRRRSFVELWDGL